MHLSSTDSCYVTCTSHSVHLDTLLKHPESIFHIEEDQVSYLYKIVGKTALLCIPESWTGSRNSYCGFPGCDTMLQSGRWYELFRGIYCFHILPKKCKRCAPSKYLYPPMRLQHDAITQKTMIWIYVSGADLKEHTVKYLLSYFPNTAVCNIVLCIQHSYIIDINQLKSMKNVCDECVRDSVLFI
jgi:hypothetical protein